MSTTGWLTAAGLSPSIRRSTLGQGSSLRPAPMPTRVRTMSGRSKVARAARMAAPVGVTSSDWAGVGTRGACAAGQDLEGGRRGQGQQAVVGVHLPAAVGQGGGVQALDAQLVQPNRRADHVDDRIERADLVEMHLVDGRCRARGLRLRPAPGRPLSALALTGSGRWLSPMMAWMSERWRWWWLCGATTVIWVARRAPLCTSSTCTSTCSSSFSWARLFVQQFRRQPGVDQRGQEHVPADSGKTIAKCQLH